MKEYNLRERAEIVSLAQECAKSLKAQPLIDYFQKKETPVEARSGRTYRSIPDGMDVEVWDKMTPIERLHYIGAIVEKPINLEDCHTVEDCRHFDEAQGRHKCCHPQRKGRCEFFCNDFELRIAPPTGTAEAVTAAARHEMQKMKRKWKEYGLLTDTDAKEDINTDAE
jgi:hypothetical protein